MQRAASTLPLRRTLRRLARKRVWLGLAAALVILPLALPLNRGHAQNQDTPLVIFIQGRRPLNTTGISNIGPEGLSKLADIFSSMGAQVAYRNITEPLPDEAAVVVLARPMRSIGVVEAAYLWTYLEAGGNLLIALDPENVFLASPSVRAANIRSRIGRGALPDLFDADYGVRMYDTFVAEPGVTTATVKTVQTTYSVAQADAVPNPLTEPLQRFGVPVWVWGARHMRVEPFVIGGQALPLIYTDTAFAESNPGIFPTGRAAADAATAPVEMNLGEDFIGRLNLGAAAVDPSTGARLVVLGDSEMIQNGFGLVSSGPTPRYPGNRMLAERLAAWLLELPVEDWPDLPEGFSWIALDGSSADWPARGPLAASDPPDPLPPNLDLQRVLGYADNRYVYLAVETAAPPDATVRVVIPPESLGDGASGGQLVVSAAGVVIEREGSAPVSVTDAAVGVGAALELRLPQRLFRDPPRLVVCTQSADDPAASDCLDRPFTVPYTTLLAPYDWALVDQRLATVYTNGGVFIRTGPGTDKSIVGTVYNGTAFAVLERNADASWIRVRNANYDGWMAAFLLTANNDLALLPEASALQG